jgi:trimethylamine:corrinoid methyltransferase-like protein
MDERKLGIESIKNSGPGGNFLIDELTLSNLHGGEFFESPYLDLSGGYGERSRSMYEIAHEEAVRLVEEYTPTVPESVVAAVREHMGKRYVNPYVADI